MFLEMNYKSEALGKDTTLNVIIPQNKENYKTLWLLHGLSGDHTAWIRNTNIERYAKKYGIAVVMPNADRSRYTNTAYGAKYFDFIADELPKLCRETFRGMSDRCEDNIIAGLSMGGYGSLKFALSRPEQYGACISLSGSMDITRKGRTCPLDEWKSIFDFTIEDPLTLEGTEHDLFALAEKCKKENKPIPRIYMWCRLQDYLLNVNYQFDSHLTSLDIPHEFKMSEGDHSWKWWDLHIQNALAWALVE